MSYFEECLRLGEWLSEVDRRALYKYLLEINKDAYRVHANLLLNNSTLNKTIANGEVILANDYARTMALGSVDNVDAPTKTAVAQISASIQEFIYAKGL